MPFDFHNHLQSGRFGKEAGVLVQEMKAAGVTGCVANATRESDWDELAELAQRFPGYVFPAYGIHPWFADTAEEGWEGRLVFLLRIFPAGAEGQGAGCLPATAGRPHPA